MNLRFFSFSLVTLVCAGLAPQAFAQAGNDNPGGVTAEYHGSITTAGYYDPYTGNAKREIDDIVVPGSIGAYPLKYTRTFNTRGNAEWTNNYEWSLWVRPPNEDLGNGDGFYDGPVRGIQYPNGGHFDTIVYDSPWFIEASGPHGASDKLVTCASGACTPGSGAAYELWRADGGKVLFEHVHGSRGYAIIDPYGQTTTLSYDGSGRLWKVTEPGGRYLELVYQTFTYWYPWPDATHNAAHWASEVLLTAVRANDGRGNTIETVSYGYEWVWQGDYFPEYVPYLNHAYYDDTPATQATYTYAEANNYDTPDYVTHGHLRRVLHSCDDPRYAGPMKYIEYEYVPWTESTGDPYFVGRGQIKAEKNVSGQIVSRTTYPTSTTDPNLWRRTETRGDGPSRTLNYNSVSFIWTDFKNQPFTEADWSTSSTLYGWAMTDPRGNTTTYERETVLDGLRKITYPQTDPTQTPATREYIFSDPNNPYYHYKEKDENGRWTTFDRDGYHRVTKITYPDASTEEFTYNGFGQVLTHKLRSDGTETVIYDTRGLKTASYPPPTESDANPQHPTVYTYYEAADGHTAWIDRLKSVKDPLNHYTSYEYNQRGQVTKVTHHDGTYTQSAYNLDGTLAWTADENHPGAATDANQRTRYTYDEYKRVLTVTNPMGETTENCYALDSAWYDPSLRKPLLHTTNTVKYTLSPMQKNVIYDYDENFRKKDQVAAFGTATDEAWTWFDYDEVGNLTWVRDPRLKITTFHYDQRNRKVWMDDPIAVDRNSSGHTMNWVYDSVGNKLKETRADNAYRSWDYDLMNRVWHAFDWRYSDPSYQITTYDWNTTGTYRWITDAKGAVYTFVFDALGRKLYEFYPSDQSNVNRLVAYWYDVAGNLVMFKNPAEQYRHFSYDERNRQRHSWWNDNAGQDIATDYDAASRMTNITTNSGETNVAFFYDEANRKYWEEQTVAGLETRWVYAPRDADGNRKWLQSGGYYFSYDYTQRNQLARIRDGSTSPVCEFTYDPSGNMTQRKIAWFFSSPSNFEYDDLNRVTMFEDGNTGGMYARSHYQYDTVGREAAVWRDEDWSKGDRFHYSANNQLTGARYKGDWAWAGDPNNPERTVDYAYRPDMLNRQSVTDNGAVTNYASPSGMNQYGSVGNQAIGYDDRFNVASYNGATFTYDAENRLVGGSMQAIYDGLGRCVKRTVNGVTRFITYDEWNPIYEWDASGNPVGANFYGARADEIIGRWDSSQGFLFYKQDKQGNVMTVLNQGGGIVEKYRYDAFGAPKVTDGAGNAVEYANHTPKSGVGNRFMYTGREYIQELGIYDYRHRMYHPGLGRFLQTDPMGLQTEGEKLSPGQKALFSPGGSAPEAFSSSEMNLFRYCGNDPVDKADSWGLAPGDSYPTVDAAGIQAIRDINERSIAMGIEYSGMLYRMSGGSFSYTAPVPGGSDHSPANQRIPRKTTFEGSYHTHGRYDPPYDYHNYIFSERDRRLADGWNRPEYLGNPAGEVRKYTPNLVPLGGKSETIASSQPLPPPPPPEDRTFHDLFAPFKKFWK
jgi:RHS repeat-associated protein